MSALALAPTPPSSLWQEKADRVAPLLQRAETWAELPNADPVYAAIVNHWRARRRLATCADLLPDDPGYEEADAQEGRLVKREVRLLRVLFNTSPTTVDGLLALLEYIAEFPEEVDAVLPGWLHRLAGTIRNLAGGLQS
jgi:hypothetical protein